MKILLINDYGYEVGGAETYLLNLKIALQKRGHIVKILTSNAGSKNLFSDYTFQSINQNSFMRVFPYMWNTNSLKAVARVIKEFQPDIVHLQFVFYHASPSILLALRGIPTVYTAHAHELIGPMGVTRSKKCKHSEEESCIHCLGFTKYFPEKIKMMLFSFLKKTINIYITPSKHHLALLKNYGFHPIKHIYNGISLLPAMPLKTNNKLLYVGRLAEDKGVITLLQAMQYIIKAIPNAKLTIVGSGPEETNLKNFVNNNNLEQNVVFTGKINNKEIIKYYADSEIVIIPSLYPDNLPTICIEAMSVGRPIVGSNLGGIPELIDDKKTGFLFTAGDYKELAKKTVTILTNKNLAEKMSKNAVIKSKEFDINIHVERVEQLYKQMKKSTVTS